MKAGGFGVVAFVAMTILIIISEAQSSSDPGGVVTIRLERFSNPRSRMYIQSRRRVHCCDIFCTPCDPYFELCLKMTQGSRKCAQTFRTKTFSNKKIIVFARNEILKTKPRPSRNPVKFTFSRWQGFLNLRIVIKDQDYTSVDDFMDSFLIQKSLHPSPGAGNARWYTFNRRGKTSQLRVSYSVQCNKDYYGPECTERCQPRNDHQGHYSCDKITGLKRCLSGWLGQRCTVFCKDSVGSRCDYNGNKICLPHWYGKDCSKNCVPAGNFVCNISTGVRQCASGWFGKRCNVHCVRTGGATETYSCSKTGQKICHKDWYGVDCDKHCVPMRNSVCNKATGDRVCDKNWYGTSCERFCLPRNDQNAAFSCDTAGQKMCYPHWYGADCGAFCIPSSDMKYVCNKTTGAKDCAWGWGGADCDKRVCTPRNDRNAGFTCDVKGQRKCLINWYPEGRCNVYCQQLSPAYRCNQRTGEKVCRPGWYPSNRCDVYCLPRADMNAAYACDPLTGDKSCQFGWYGPQCDCFPTNDNTAGYTCDKMTGARVCLPEWTGTMCDFSDN